MDRETKTSANSQSDLPWGDEDREHDPKDSEQHRTQQQGTGHGGSRASRMTEHLGQRRAGRSRHLGQVVIWGVTWDCGHVGWKHRHGHLLRWGQVYLSAYLGCALVVEARLRVMENPKQKRPCGRLKAEVRPLVSLPTAKPLSWFYPVARNSAL